MNFSELYIDGSWTLFLDRDGVINRRVMDGYVTKWAEFEFLPGAREAIVKLSGKFGRIIVVTNQQGVGKGVMSREAVQEIHEKMISDLEEAGGRIDKVYFSPHLSSEDHPMRKPGTGMYEKALDDFPGIEKDKCMMVGDTPADILFGKRAGMKTVLVGPVENDFHPPPDFKFRDLQEFAGQVS